MTEERKREIELELVDIADSLMSLVEELGAGLEIHAFKVVTPEKNYVTSLVSSFYHKDINGDEYIASARRYVPDNGDINPLAGFLDEKLTEWTKVPTREEDN